MKKKVSIITIHSIYNYGSALQSYATNRYINSLGYDAELIDYRPKYDKSLKRLIKDIGIKILFINKYGKRKKNYKEFHNNYMNLSSCRYYEYSDLVKNPPISDIYVSGSDQVWNTYFPCGKDEAYTLGFIESNNKLAYAASMGRSDMPLNDLKLLAERIKSYRWISMREKSGVEQLKKVNIESINVCDPVFLLPAKHYFEISKESKYKNYILVYSVHKSKILSEIVEEYHKKFGLKVILVGDFPVNCYHDISLKEAGPLEFLGLIKNASLIITNSFHCVSFSLIMEKQFVVVMPEVNMSRIINILSIAGLENIFISDKSEVLNFNVNIDYKIVSPKILEYAEFSRKEFSNALNMINIGEEGSKYECI